MPSRHKAPLLGWHPPAELSAWVRAEAERREMTVTALLNEIVSAARAASLTETGLSDREYGHMYISQCVCDVFGGCPQGCPKCAVCWGLDDDDVDFPDTDGKPSGLDTWDF